MSVIRRESNTHDMHSECIRKERKEAVNQNDILTKLLKELSVQRQILHSLMQTEEEQEKEERLHYKQKKEWTRESSCEHHVHDLRNKLSSSADNRNGSMKDAQKCNVNNEMHESNNSNIINYQVTHVDTNDNSLCCEEVSALTECSPSPTRPSQLLAEKEKQKEEEEEEQKECEHRNKYYYYNHHYRLLLSPEPTDTQERTNDEKLKYTSHTTADENVCDNADVIRKTAEYIMPACPAMNADKKQITNSSAQVQSRTSQTNAGFVSNEDKEKSDKEELFFCEKPLYKNLNNKTSDDDISNTTAKSSFAAQMPEEEKPKWATAKNVERNDEDNTMVSLRCNENTVVNSNKNKERGYNSSFEKTNEIELRFASLINMIEE